jgi:hypothetical protein
MVGRSFMSNVDGEAWVEPAQYWERIAYPAYVRAHSHLFLKGNVESGQAKNLNLLVLNGEGTEQNLTSDDFFRMAADTVLAGSWPRKQSLFSFLCTRL